MNMFPNPCSIHAELSKEFLFLCQHCNIRIYNRFLTIIRFQSKVLFEYEYNFLLNSARAVYES